MKRLKARTARANLKKYMDGKEPVAIGTDWQVRAVLVPVPAYSQCRAGTEAQAVKQTIESLRKHLTAKSLDWQHAE